MQRWLNDRIFMFGLVTEKNQIAAGGRPDTRDLTLIRSEIDPDQYIPIQSPLSLRVFEGVRIDLLVVKPSDV